MNLVGLEGSGAMIPSSTNVVNSSKIYFLHKNNKDQYCSIVAPTKKDAKFDSGIGQKACMSTMFITSTNYKYILAEHELE